MVTIGRALQCGPGPEAGINVSQGFNEARRERRDQLGGSEWQTQPSVASMRPGANAGINTCAG